MDKDEDSSMRPDTTDGETIASRRLTDEQRYFFERAYKEPVESIPRLEEVAKFLVGATATTSGLFLAAFKLSLGDTTITGLAWFLPFLCWALGIVAFILVLFPQTYRTGRDEPASWKAAFLQARRRKYGWLFVGTLLFIAGLFAAVYPFTL
jgi:hypothetical protein